MPEVVRRPSVIVRAGPAIARQFDTPADENHAFFFEPSALGQPGRAARRHRKPATSIDYSMPGQAGRTTMHGIAGLSRGPGPSGIDSQIAVCGDTAGRNKSNQRMHCFGKALFAHGKGARRGRIALSVMPGIPRLIPL